MYLATVMRITNSLTLGYPQEVPLQVDCAMQDSHSLADP
jgi:hypothetical protein